MGFFPPSSLSCQNLGFSFCCFSWASLQEDLKDECLPCGQFDRAFSEFRFIVAEPRANQFFMQLPLHPHTSSSPRQRNREKVCGALNWQRVLRQSLSLHLFTFFSHLSPFLSYFLNPLCPLRGASRGLKNPYIPSHYSSSWYVHFFKVLAVYPGSREMDAPSLRSYFFV